MSGHAKLDREAQLRFQGVVSAERYLKRLERQAGPALNDREGVRRRLAEAEKVFADGDHLELTLLQTAAAGRRIAYLADQLRVLEKLPYAQQLLESRRAEL